ncbi:MAG: class I mannose-6-phosphate isomerase [Clostridia bacterium]|nr:class I mannose-6-phosphate isomerase [Clostridia bacterium]MBQ9807172.1 class I mannose-6-phosphate isomerase [Clostridia bacterium]
MSGKVFKQLPTLARRTYRGGKLLGDFVKLESAADTNCPEDWISSFVEAKNKDYIPNEGITRVLTDQGECLITEAVEVSDFGEGRQNSGVLIKLLDAGERLGIQVHPTKEYAMEHFGTPYGKTECWYILNTRSEDACVYLGFREHVTKEYFKMLFEKQDIQGMLDAMHCFRVQAGDVILVTAGTPHAIGAGCFLLEIQEPTDYTMRAEKVTVAGEVLTPQQIHYGVGETAMLDCFSYAGGTEEEIRERHFLRPCQVEKGIFDLVRYNDTECFALKRIEGGVYEAKEECFVTVVVLEDSGTLSYDGLSVPLARGEKYFIGAGTAFTLSCATAVLCYPPRL